jgi:sugar O-acyltransferase (sialic acid O-acetyltransferase NeuD family)
VKAQASEGLVIVYGASGHGKVVADILRACGVEVEGFVDDDPLKSAEVSGLKILGDAKWLAERAAREPVAVALGIGDNFARRAVAERSVMAGVQLLTAVHPSATIAPSAKISPGVVIMAHAVVNADAVMGRGAIINTAAIVEHDCNVGNFAHLSPKVAIGGNVQIGDLAWLGIGSTVIPGVNVGMGSIIGAGATVLHDVDDWVVAVGTPARILKEVARRI